MVNHASTSTCSNSNYRSNSIVRLPTSIPALLNRSNILKNFCSSSAEVFFRSCNRARKLSTNSTGNKVGNNVDVFFFCLLGCVHHCITARTFCKPKVCGAHSDIFTICCKLFTNHRTSSASLFKKWYLVNHPKVVGRTRYTRKVKLDT